VSERWERVTSLFGAARALDVPARDWFLRAACGDDELRAEVEALLAADVSHDGFLEDPPWARLAPSSDVGPALGAVLKGRYRVESELAVGGQALVYLAEDQALRRPVVIKVMRAEGRRIRSLKSRFQQEMRALARIDHPGVVGILDVGDLDDGSPFLVIQHIPGRSLREVLAQEPIPPTRAAAILRQMGSALRAAHAAGIAHRDLKPENVMVQRRDGGGDTVRLIDFGLAKIDQSDLEPHTTTVMVAGTVRYMAPEQFEGRYTTASDVYAVALVACEMLSGHPHVRALPKATRPATRALLESALAFRAEDRPSDIQAWSERLAATLAPERSRRARIAAGVGVVAIAAAAAATGRWVVLSSVPPARIVEKVGGFDPTTEGFRTHGDPVGMVLENPTRTGYDGWRVSTDKMAYYFQPLTGAQKRLALERGWKLTAEMRDDEGLAYAGVDFGGTERRFDINLLVEGDDEVVRLLTQIVPEWRGLDSGPRPTGGYHRYELVYDASLKSANLWVDGERRLTGYRGHRQYVEDNGLVFGAALYKGRRGAGSFRSLRFEINP
jgi:serine/threonine protein kinase